MSSSQMLHQEEVFAGGKLKRVFQGQKKVNPFAAWAVILLVAVVSTAVFYGIGKAFFWDKYSTAPFYEQQFESLRKRVAADPNNVENLVALGWIYFQKGDFTQALQYFNQASALNDRYFPAAFNTGLAYLQTGQYGAAVTAFQNAAQLAPRDHVTQMNLGIAYTLNDEYEKAFDALLKAYTLKPGSADILIKLGEAYQKAGLLDKAKEAFREALIYDPNNETAKNALKQLGQ